MHPCVYTVACMCVCVRVFVLFYVYRVSFLLRIVVYFVCSVCSSLFASYSGVVGLRTAGRLPEQPDCSTGPSIAESEISAVESDGANANALRCYPSISSNSIRRSVPERRTGNDAPFNSSFLSLSPRCFFLSAPFYVSSSPRVPSSRLPSHWAQ